VHKATKSTKGKNSVWKENRGVFQPKPQLPWNWTGSIIACATEKLGKMSSM